MAATHRLYIDESGDHTYRHLDELSRRYLGITGLLLRKDDRAELVEQLNKLKRRFFHYDPDAPPILTRRMIIDRKSWFGVLRDEGVNTEWETQILAFCSALRAQIFTVVIDKFVHYENFGSAAWNPYSYSLAVLLRRIRGYLRIHGGCADIMPEARGRVEDGQLMAAYHSLLTEGSPTGEFGTADEYREAFPETDLLFRRKEAMSRQVV